MATVGIPSCIIGYFFLPCLNEVQYPILFHLVPGAGFGGFRIIAMKEDGVLIWAQAEPVEERSCCGGGNGPAGKTPACERIIGIVVAKDLDADSGAVKADRVDPLDPKIAHAENLVIVNEKMWAGAPPLFIPVKMMEILDMFDRKSFRALRQRRDRRVMKRNGLAPTRFFDG